MMLKRKPEQPAQKEQKKEQKQGSTADLLLSLSQQRELSVTLIETSRNMATIIRSNAKAHVEAAQQMERMAANMQDALSISDHAIALLKASEGA